MCLLNFVLFFQVNYKCNYGDSVYVVGSISALGNWNPQKAVKLTWSDGHNWSTKLRIIHDNRETIQYKYFVGPTILPGPQSNLTWERGPNRFVNLYSTSKLYVTLKDEWEHLRVKVAVQNDTLKKRLTNSQQMFITTNLEDKPLPIEMELKQLTMGGELKEDSFWIASFVVPFSISCFGYKLKVTDTNTNETQGDRTYRKFDVKKFPSHLSLNELYTIKGSALTKFDFRYGASFNFDKITDEISVGSFPSNSQDVEELLSSGVKAVLNLQTLGDMNRYSVNWDSLKTQYQKAKITVEHYPIMDMDKTDLALKIQNAANLIEKLVKEHGKLYVHCSAGKYRSPHAVIYYLWQHKQYNLEAAIELTKKKRRKARVSIFQEVFAQKKFETISHTMPKEELAKVAPIVY